MLPSRETLATLAAAAGPNAVRAATAADAIEGTEALAVVEPESPETVARLLAWASDARRSVVVRGGGTKLCWGRKPTSIDVILSTRRLSRVRFHAHGDLTAEVEAGITLETMNRELLKERQWLPLESAFAGATIGGMLATNDAGPAQHRFGTPRDLLIGVQLATTDGRLVKAGGNVVKNVAGYDLGKLVTGSFGSLAVIVAATFKLMPLAAGVGTVRATFKDGAVAARAAHAVAASQLDPIALDVTAAGTPGEGAAPAELLVRFASTTAVVKAEMEKAAELLARFEPVRTAAIVGAADEEAIWRAHRGRAWEGTSAVIKLSWLPASLEAVLAVVSSVYDRTTCEFTCRAGIGLGLLRVDGDAGTQVDMVLKLRQHGDLFRQVTVLRADPPVKAAVDVWGGHTPAATLHDAIKRAFDPAGILNAGRGPV